MVHTPHRRVILDMDSSESPVHGQQEGAAYNGHFECVCYHPLFLFNQFGDCEAATLRPGNVHSADDWQELLEPVVKGYRKRDCGFCFGVMPPLASPRYTSIWNKRRLGTQSGFQLTRYFREKSRTCWYGLLSGLPKSPRLISRLRLPGPELECFPKSGGQDGVAPGRTVSQNRLHRDQPELSSHRDSPFLQRPRYGGAMDKGRQIRPELDQVVVSQVRGQSGQAGTLRTGLHLGNFMSRLALPRR